MCVNCESNQSQNVHGAQIKSYQIKLNENQDKDKFEQWYTWWNILNVVVKMLKKI